MKISKQLVLVLAILTIFGCSKGGSSSPDGAQQGQQISSAMGNMIITGVQVLMYGETIADLSQPTPVVSSYGTVTQGVALNYVNAPDAPFIIYGDRGVYAAECELNPTDPLYESMCQVANVENHGRLLMCFGNQAGADLAVAQQWTDLEHAFDEGHGLICYLDGVKLKSNHFYSY